MNNSSAFTVLQLGEPLLRDFAKHPGMRKLLQLTESTTFHTAESDRAVITSFQVFPISRKGG